MASPVTESCEGARMMWKQGLGELGELNGVKPPSTLWFQCMTHELCFTSLYYGSKLGSFSFGLYIT